MDNAHPHIAPRGRFRVPVVVAEDGQRQGDGVEGGGLLVQVVVVVGNLAVADGDLGVEVGLDLVGLDGAVVLAHGGDARRVHPRLHHKGPAGQHRDRLDEGGVEAQLGRHLFSFLRFWSDILLK